ncbi:T6SS phospholipase effector Tle1-like catalytic domain-containing protein [Acinetobacter ursingii]|uniref:T6SS phospholipase effector Tle1-like catalytic domain-containing protein n=1 Tax=Acinetobacter ursingii TaxID=108980 RepID=UPI003AF5F132
MLKKSIIQRTLETNSDVSNTPPMAKQDCTDVVHISVFFDGTGNNKDADEDKKKWSNPARLWRNAQSLKETELAENNQLVSPNHAIYVSGVGTRFNAELNIFQRAISVLQDHTGLGLGIGLGGTRRLDYGEDQLNDALKQVLIFNAKKAKLNVDKYANEKKVYSFAEVEKSLSQHRLIKKINISTFGFSRGAALARAFTNQFIWQCESGCDGLTYGTGKYPIEFKFLGIFDTVASFGLPATNLNNNLTFKGRDLVIDERVKMCVHHIAGNELRFAFPLDLIHKENGDLTNTNWKEIVYPGMHSDVGGGYTPGSQNVNDNFARIPLKDMLTEAVNYGVRMYDYDELKVKHSKVFEQQFAIQEETQRLFNAVNQQMQCNGKVQDQIIAAMKVYYSAYGTLARTYTPSVSQQVRSESKIRELIPIGPSDMATEISRLQKLKDLTAPSKPGGFNIFRVLSPISKAYEFFLGVDEWEFSSWNNNATQDVVDFYQSYVHDSKYGFISNAEPFSYFRQRKIYESPRSKQGKEIDEKLVAEKAVCSIVKRDVKQDELFDAYDKAQKEQQLLATS